MTLSKRVTYQSFALLPLAGRVLSSVCNTNGEDMKMKCLRICGVRHVDHVRNFGLRGVVVCTHSLKEMTKVLK